MPLKGALLFNSSSGVSVSRIGESMVIALYVREAPNMCVMRILRMRDGNLRRGSSMLKAGICGVDVIYT